MYLANENDKVKLELSLVDINNLIRLTRIKTMSAQTYPI